MVSLLEQFEHNTRPGPNHRSLADLPDLTAQAFDVRYIAYYLPQFHAIPENDLWWGKGFTEWTNVTKALPRYVGQLQPRLPGDLGFYDLSNPDHIRRQVELANRAGIYGFCIHNYWHSGHRLLETPLRIIQKNKDINLRFCLNWANESWSRRWDGSESEILIEQKYLPGEDVQYAEYVSEFMEDERYIRINGRPLIMIYRPSQLPDARATVERWREFFVKRGLGDPYVIFPQLHVYGTFPQLQGDHDPRPYGMDAAAGFPPHMVGFETRDIRHGLKMLDRAFLGRVFSYDEMIRRSLANRPTEYLLLPGVCPSWDNQARKRNHGLSFAEATPAKYGRWLRAMTQRALTAPSADERIVFINAWNEWAEGAYLEPDVHNGYAYLVETAAAVLNFKINSDEDSSEKGVSELEISVETFANHLRNAPYRFVQGMSRRMQRLRNR